jgi:hypothetical protein
VVVTAVKAAKRNKNASSNIILILRKFFALLRMTANALKQ